MLIFRKIAEIQSKLTLRGVLPAPIFSLQASSVLALKDNSNFF